MNRNYIIFVILIFYSFCKTSTIILPSILENSSNITMVDHKIQFNIPSNWYSYYSSKRYFHFVAKLKNSIYGPRLEYRGLNNTTKTKEERDLYSSGWYQANEINFPNWKLLEKGYQEINYKNTIIYSYSFLGEFIDNNIKIIKIGYLRFIKDKIHAIYYTSEEKTFNENYSLFMEIDKNIVYDLTLNLY